MSVVSDVASPCDILGHVSENVSDTTFHVSNVSDVCQVSGVLLTDIKSTYPAKSAAHEGHTSDCCVEFLQNWLHFDQSQS